MKRDNKKLLLVCALGLLLASPLRAYAIGQITEPIEIKDALRGMSYERTITVVNTEGTAAEINLSASDEIAGWVKFYETAASTESIEKTSLGATTKKDIIARFSIPAGTPNKTYKGYVSVANIPKPYENNGIDSGNSVTQKIDREVAIGVSDQEKVDFNVSIIPETYDLAQGDLLKIRVLYDNQGNIDISPQIDLKIKQNDSTAYSAIFPYPETIPAVKPAAIFEIPALEIPTGNFANGKYTAYFAIKGGDKFSTEQKFNFSVGTVKGASTASAGNHSLRYSALSKPIAYASFLLLFLIILRPGIFKKKKIVKVYITNEDIVK